MKVPVATQFCLQYQMANAKGNSLKNYKYVLYKFNNSFGEREIETITVDIFRSRKEINPSMVGKLSLNDYYFLYKTRYKEHQDILTRSSDHENAT